MKKLIVLLGVFFLTVPGAWAQSTQIKQVEIGKDGNNSSSYATINGGVSNEDFQGLANTFPHIAALNQFSAGKNQAAIINQIGKENQTLITQSGGNNSGAIYINGDFNKTSLNQIGNDYSVLDVAGSSNHFNIDQQAPGVKNYILLNADGVHMNTIQNSTGLLLQQQGGNGVPLQIKVSGRNIPIKINNH